MTPEPHDKFNDLIADFDTAMLVSRGAGGELRSRPMSIADVEPDGKLWGEPGTGRTRDSHLCWGEPGTAIFADQPWRLRALS